MPIEDTTLERRHVALKALLLATVPFSVLFCLLNIAIDSLVLAMLNALLLVICLGLLVVIRRRRAPAWLVLLYLTAVFSNFLWLSTLPNIYPTSHTWLPVVPVMCYLLLEPRLGLRMACLTLIAAIPAYLIGAQREPILLEMKSSLNVLAPVLGLFVACHFYTRCHTRVRDDMLQRILTDPLTGLWNRDKLTGEFERERQRVLRMGKSCSLILIDLDHFKKLNDSYGHDAGDAALICFSTLLEERVRRTDLACRVGGEEFIVLLPETDATGALAIAEDLRLKLEKNSFRYGDVDVKLTLSAGIAEMGRDGDTWTQLYRAADARLYLCKERGRNCVSNGQANLP